MSKKTEDQSNDLAEKLSHDISNSVAIILGALGVLKLKYKRTDLMKDKNFESIESGIRRLKKQCEILKKCSVVPLSEENEAS